ncbi:mannose-6-phosphate isomerase, class I [Planomicrobium sp. CPCC 101079]|uniref:mannose-6-phosphate isomerase, class I n=1 Tax=Planomicrobium sp. CPCC 101079 TaxID=2599618 RepID=UPI0011B4FE37|nr:mannose-6-phosphate isomerase, class I [Planomicrobium sp. CPCC 101079]TWT03604.1 mannose-6-phosphate isomerase, class I [Planomicrobium sp. CPCC 101079]
MNQPIFLSPVFQERIWGGTKLRTEFDYEIESDITGECWAVSAHPNGPSVVNSGPYKGKTLIQLWDESPDLFGNVSGDVFPLLTKILDANTDLSVQVHPDDTYAQNFENGELGKTECWYIIDCEEGSELVIGHTAQTKEQFNEVIEKGEWNELLRRVKVKPGDFFYVPSGTIHAIGSGILILETQQSSDTTYRVYDYDRVDQNGQKRELHLEKSVAVATIPHEDYTIAPVTTDIPGAKVIMYIQEENFSVYKWEISEAAAFKQDEPFLIGSVLKGTGEIITSAGNYPIEKGTHFILPNGLGEFEIKGEVELIVSHP